MKTIFDLCQPRSDIIEGRVRDEEFVAELSQVINETAVPEYADPKLFFRYTYPTRGLKTLLDTVCRRLSGKGGELNSVIRLDTQYGGGKTHSLIALVHTARGMKGVGNISEFLDPAFLPKENVRIAALSGENSDPMNGLKLEGNLLARSLWGEMAYQLAGKTGFERIRNSDKKHIAPGTDTIIELFGDSPCLILIDEVSVYLRKAAEAFPDTANQFTAFIQSLIKAVSSTPRVALVCTLAVSAEDQKAADAYEAEHHLAVQAFEEAKRVASRKLLQIDPTEEHETANVLRRRLFEDVDKDASEEVIRAYKTLWDRNREVLSPDALVPEIRDQFRGGYPLHPETLNVMMEKLSSLATFQRTRGMLRLLTRTVCLMWENRPEDAHAIHPHHIDPGHPSIRSEFTSKLGQEAFSPALAADVAAVPGKDPAIAQWLDAEHYPGQAPVTSYAARTIFINTMAFGDAAQGISKEHLSYSVCSPSIEPAFVEAAQRLFKEESLYLDDRPGTPMRFRVQPNLTQMITRAMKDVDAGDMRNVLNERIRDLFKGKKGDFEPITFPQGPGDIPDEVGSGKPYLVILHYDAHPLSEMPSELPPDLARMATQKGRTEETRLLQNNLVFLVADRHLCDNMKHQVCRRLALEAIQSGPQMEDLADYQQEKLREFYQKSEAESAIAIHQCYRHLFYPSKGGIGSGKAKLGHTTIEFQNTSDAPGKGQHHIRRALRDQKKLLMAGDTPDGPTFVRDQTPLKNKGQVTVSELRNEYRKAPNLSILMDDAPLIQCIRTGIEQEVFIYREGEQLWGKGEPDPAIRISENAFVHTMEDAKKRNLWPRPEPEKSQEPDSPGNEDEEKETWKGNISGDKGGIKEADKMPLVLSAEGPLRQALVQLFEDARKHKAGAFVSMRIRFFEYKGAGMFHQTLSTYRDADVSCSFEITLESEGVEEFEVHFSGTLQKAGRIRSFMEPQLRTAASHSFEGEYKLAFKTPLSTSEEKANAFVETMIRYGGAEAYIEAEAAPQENE